MSGRYTDAIIAALRERLDPIPFRPGGRRALWADGSSARPLASQALRGPRGPIRPCLRSGGAAQKFEPDNTDRAALCIEPGPIAEGGELPIARSTAPRNSSRRSVASGADNPSSIARSAGVSISGMGRGSSRAGEFGADDSAALLSFKLAAVLTEVRAVAVSRLMQPYWAAVRSLPQRERFAVEQLGLRGYETFLPLVATKRAVAPLFASYLFCRIVERWHAINTCFGVLALVRVGDCPCRVPDYEIAALKARADPSGIIRLPPPPPPRSQRRFAKGEKVRITARQFAHFDAIHSGMRRGELERVLITILGGQREVSVARHLVEAR